ncbi:Regulator of chromosome condensation 1/beta-lactamase-inhibitor protein II [Pseudocohnilembus persalinus]|uniref:Regulator of chromosome condensation 1/beta-lactamase-inhibitor protein II n=1 Tax=Pseudocohnilembus persalinus TaxID=266149 RepID=A0A0V0QB86_PSEPJ|nr:Regulator of chromosome condensation 1/beta-lactamase-inhibitor protein II [Pseudocohnilembus persalinus]|eukprot:KRW99419.1 Regulator of chromosome condensation 1/beta-lactamase-inhibitor protein II [Pseudocohnilembus persalinus]
MFFTIKQVENNQNDNSDLQDIYVTPTELLVYNKNNELQYIDRIECGYHHTVLIVGDKGHIYYFGMGKEGILGNGKFENVEKPQLLNKNDFHMKHKIINVACGSGHTLALSSKLVLFSWGKNNRGQLGIGTINDSLYPEEVRIQNENIIYISAGDQHSAAITQNNELYTWGNGEHFRLGHGVDMDEIGPKKVDVLEDVYVKHVSCGSTHTLAITNEGFVYSWGQGLNGKLGHSKDDINDQQLPIRCGIDKKSFKKHIFYQVSAGQQHSMALTQSGILYTWGSSKNGVLGYKTVNDMECLPKKVSSIATGYKHVLVVTELGECYGWGSNSNYQLGLGYCSKYVHEPQKIVGALETKNIKMAVASDKFSAVLTDQGEIWSFGTSQSGVLGLQENNFYQISEPRLINDIPPMNYIAASPGSMMAIQQMPKNSKFSNLYAWGNNQYGQLGIKIKSVESVIYEQDDQMSDINEQSESDNDQSEQFQDQISNYNKNNKISSNYKSKAVKQGKKYKKNIKNLTIYSPQLVDFPEKQLLVQVQCGIFHSVVMNNQGTLYSCGLNQYSGHYDMIKNNSFNDYLDIFTPLSFDQSLKSNKFIHFSVGEYHSLAINQNNDVYGWGSSKFGKLGTVNPVKDAREYYNDMHIDLQIKNIKESQKEFLPPMKISNLQQIQAVFVSAGQYHSNIIDQYGQVFCLGSDIQGQMGINSKENQNNQDIKDQYNSKNIYLNPQQIRAVYASHMNDLNQTKITYDIIVKMSQAINQSNILKEQEQLEIENTM